MSSRTRLIVMSISAPVIAFAIVGGFLGKVMAGQDAPYQHLKIFDDVVTVIRSQYVEEVNIDKVMNGAMHGLADGLDPDSAYLTPDEVKQVEAGTPLPAAGVGLELTRQYYLRVIAARDNSPAAKAGLHTGDYIRAINDTATREMSVWEGVRALRGALGTKVSVTVIRGNAADPRVIELTREAEPSSTVTRRMAGSGIGYVRIAALGAGTPAQVKSHIADLTKGGATKLIVDVRRASSAAPRRCHAGAGKAAYRGSPQGRRDEVDRRRAARAERHAGRRARAGPPVRRQGHARAARVQRRRARDDRGRIRRRVRHASHRTAHRHRHIGRRGALRVGTGGKSARGSDRRAHHRPRRDAEADQTAGRRGAVAVDHTLSDALGRAAA